MWVCPRAAFAALLVCSSLQTTAVAGEPALSEILSQWERTAAHARPVGRSDRARLLQDRVTPRSAHTVDVICTLSGPVDVEQLQQRFRWSALPSDGRRIRLAAEPRDEIEAMFFRRVEITFGEAGLPESLRFIGLDGQMQGPRVTVARHWRQDIYPVALAGNGQSTPRREPRLLRVAELDVARPLQPVGVDPYVEELLAKWSESMQNQKADGHTLSLVPAEPPTANPIQQVGFRQGGSPSDVTSLPDRVRFLRMDAKELAGQFHISLFGESPETSLLRLAPRNADLAGAFIEALVTLDRRTFLPQSVQLTTPDGQVEVLHTFHIRRAE